MSLLIKTMELKVAPELSYINSVEALDDIINLEDYRLCESKTVNSNFRTSMISIILRRMPSFGIRPY